jgi:signal transduction histidine kinase
MVRAPIPAKAAGAFLVLFAAYFLVFREVTVMVQAPAMIIRLVIEAATHFWIARRSDMPVRFRVAFFIFGGVSVLSLLTMGLLIATDFGVLTGAEGVMAVGGCLGYVLGSVAMLLYPRRRVRAGEWLTTTFDLVVVLVSISALQWVLLSVPSSAGIAVHDRVFTYIYSAAQVSLLVGLSLFVGLGEALPSKRAFWWIVAGLASYVPMSVLGQVDAIFTVPVAFVLSMVVYGLGGLCLVIGAVYAHSDPKQQARPDKGTRWQFGINPISFAMPLVAGSALVLAISQGLKAQTLMLALILIVVSVLLALRLLVTAAENARLRREELLTDEKVRQQDAIARREERERLLQDMHDGLASQLISARALADCGELESSQLSTLLGECLEDLQSVLDASSATESGIAAPFVDYRDRLRQRLADTGLELQWTFEVDADPGLSSSEVLQVLRILQEAINNVIKHAAARSASITLTAGTSRAFELRICDDGVGIPPQPAPGRGLKTMRERAERIGMTLSVRPRSQGKGTELVLSRDRR